MVKAVLKDHDQLDGLGLYSGQEVSITGQLNTTANGPGKPPSITVSKVEPLVHREPVKPTVASEFRRPPEAWAGRVWEA